ncbi:MAG: Crp/Fnr family transcriptional regulator [Immundisolibacter sp.]|uniref:Crp/Fnr family transcriptional regulator n=1 Tax=Immundisolibacter sp. TaxID=1934948 RepID=UPI003EE359E0
MSTAAGTSATIPRELLRRLPILGLLSDELLTQVMSASRLVRFRKKATVILKGQSLDHLSLLVAGKLQVIDHLTDGREIGLNIIQAGNFFGELAVVDRQPRSATLIALTPAMVINVPGEVARKLFFEYPPVAKTMMAHFARVIRRGNDQRSLLSLPNSFQRVFALLDYIKQKGPENTLLIDDMPTHQEVAIMANTSRETVTRALSMLTASGIIEKQVRQLLIRKPVALKRLADGEMLLNPTQKIGAEPPP